MKTTLLLIFIILLSLNSLSDQELISTAGDHYINEEAEAQISWSLGELVIATSEKPDAILTHGFHQTNLTIVSVDESYNLLSSPIVFPVSAKDQFFIDIQSIFIDPEYRLFD